MVVAIPRLTFIGRACNVPSCEREHHDAGLEVQRGRRAHRTHLTNFNVIVSCQFWTCHPITNFYEIGFAAAKENVVLWIWRMLRYWIRVCSEDIVGRPAQFPSYTVSDNII